MKPEHEQMYRDRLKRREIEEKFEEQNIADFIAAGGYDAVEYGKTGIQGHGRGDMHGTKSKGSVMNSCTLTARFSSVARLLTVRVPSEGIITVVDLTGRQVTKQVVGQWEIQNNATVHLPASFPAGIYIIKFTGQSKIVGRPMAVF